MVLIRRQPRVRIPAPRPPLSVSSVILQINLHSKPEDSPRPIGQATRCQSGYDGSMERNEKLPLLAKTGRVEELLNYAKSPREIGINSPAAPS